MVVNIECQMIQIKESKPVLLCDGRMTAVRVELIGNPNIEYNIERNSRVGKVLGHYIFV